MARDARVSTLREILRNLQRWRAVYEATGMDVIVCPNTDTEWSIYDIDQIIENGLPRLSMRQRQAIELFLIEDHPEEAVARMMGVSITNPIGMYATNGIVAILGMLDQGDL